MLHDNSSSPCSHSVLRRLPPAPQSRSAHCSTTRRSCGLNSRHHVATRCYSHLHAAHPNLAHIASIDVHFAIVNSRTLNMSGQERTTQLAEDVQVKVEDRLEVPGLEVHKGEAVRLVVVHRVDAESATMRQQCCTWTDNDRVCHMHSDRLCKLADDSTGDRLLSMYCSTASYTSA